MTMENAMLIDGIGQAYPGAFLANHAGHSGAELSVKTMAFASPIVAGANTMDALPPIRAVYFGKRAIVIFHAN